MHENLRTTFSLNEFLNRKKDTEETIIEKCSKELSPEECLKKIVYSNSNWQTLGGGYRYNTFFTLYGNIRGYFKKNENDELTFFPENCDLFIQNYNGDVTLGLAGPPTIQLVYHALIDDFVYNLNINLKPLYSNEFLLNQELFISPRGDNYFLRLSDKNQEKLKKIEGISDGSLINLNITFDDLRQVQVQNGGISRQIFDKDNLEESAFIDGHRYIRDGDQLLLKKYNTPINWDLSRINKSSFQPQYYQDIMEDFNFDDKNLPLFWTFSHLDKEGTFLDLGCHPGTIRVTF
ncbi:hypothetical protein ACWGOQ_0013565 [Aquimarina sp. M1]